MAETKTTTTTTLEQTIPAIPAQVAKAAPTPYWVAIVYRPKKRAGRTRRR